MTVAEKVRKTASEIKDDLRETVDHLKDEVAQLRDKVGQIAPFKRGRSASPAVRHDPDSPLDPRSRFFDDPWLDAAWPRFDPAWPGRPWAQALDRFNRDFFAGWPQVDVTDDEKEIRVRAELPGVDEDDVDVSLSGDTLTIRGEKRSESEDRGKEHSMYECCYGAFQRTIPLPCDVEQDRVEAKFRKGVLTVRLPKTQEARSRVRRIPVGRG